MKSNASYATMRARSERAVSEAKALVTEATGDPFSSLLTSVVTWTLSVYYER
jgi:hypothetical protein